MSENRTGFTSRRDFLTASGAALAGIASGGAAAQTTEESGRKAPAAKLEELEGLAEAPSADGAFYCLLRVKTEVDAMTLAERLIREHKVATVPGTAFGLTDGTYLRISYGALAGEKIEEGMGRLVRGIKAIAKGGG